MIQSQHWSGLTLVQVMACCLMAPSHYVSQCWLLIWGSLTCTWEQFHEKGSRIESVTWIRIMDDWNNNATSGRGAMSQSWPLYMVPEYVPYLLLIIPNIYSIYIDKSRVFKTFFAPIFFSTPAIILFAIHGYQQLKKGSEFDEDSGKVSERSGTLGISTCWQPCKIFLLPYWNSAGGCVICKLIVIHSSYHYSNIAGCCNYCLIYVTFVCSVQSLDEQTFSLTFNTKSFCSPVPGCNIGLFGDDLVEVNILFNHTLCLNIFIVP